jgi:hypothetical protein
VQSIGGDIEVDTLVAAGGFKALDAISDPSAPRIIGFDWHWP